MSLRQLVFWFCFVVVLAAAWQLLALPDEAEIKAWLRGLLASYGLWFVFFGALLEALFLIGFYFPGSLLIFIAVASASSPSNAVVLVLTVSAGVLLGYSINYGLGRYGWYQLLMRAGLTSSIERAKVKVLDNDALYILATYWNPAFASITATACGIVRLPVRRFLALSLGGVLFWNAFWGVLVYQLGESALAMISTDTVLIILFGCIVVVLLKRHYTKRVANAKR